MVKVKICGVTEPEHAIAAAEAGADFVGLMFAASKRKLTHQKACAIAQAVGKLPGAHPKLVGVFADQDVGFLNETAREVGLDLVQLSGNEPLDGLNMLKTGAIKVVHVGPGSTVEVIAKELTALRERGATTMLDTRVAGSHGGSGIAFDWKIASTLSGEFEFLLAGGLTPENVAKAVVEARPWGVDVSSGVESNGTKDLGKIRAFVRAARMAEVTK